MAALLCDDQKLLPSTTGHWNHYMYLNTVSSQLGHALSWPTMPLPTIDKINFTTQQKQLNWYQNSYNYNTIILVLMLVEHPRSLSLKSKQTSN